MLDDLRRKVERRQWRRGENLQGWERLRPKWGEWGGGGKRHQDIIWHFSGSRVSILCQQGCSLWITDFAEYFEVTVLEVHSLVLLSESVAFAMLTKWAHEGLRSNVSRSVTGSSHNRHSTVFLVVSMMSLAAYIVRIVLICFYSWKKEKDVKTCK